MSIGSGDNVRFVIDYVRLFDASLTDTFTHSATDYTDGRLWQHRTGDTASENLLFVMSFDQEPTDILSADTARQVTCMDGPTSNEIDSVTSTAPVTDDFRTQPEVSEVYNATDMAVCAEAFDRDALQDNCFGEMNNGTEQAFIEFCTDQVAAGADAESLVDLYTVYCQAVTGAHKLNILAYYCLQA